MWHRPTRFLPSGVPRDEHRVAFCASRLSPTGFCSTRFDNHVSVNRLTLDPDQRVADIKDSRRAVGPGPRDLHRPAHQLAPRHDDRAGREEDLTRRLDSTIRSDRATDARRSPSPRLWFGPCRSGTCHT